MIHGIANRGRHLRTDISVAFSRLPDFVDQAERLLTLTMPQCQPVSYGHVGDGNVHLDIIPPANLSEEGKIQAVEAAKGSTIRSGLRIRWQHKRGTWYWSGKA